MNKKKDLLETYSDLLSKIQEKKSLSIFESFLIPIIARTIQNIHSFYLLYNNALYDNSVVIIRLQIDNIIRMTAYEYSNNNFIDDFLAGKQINKMKMKDGRRMTDRNLLNKIEENDRGIYILINSFYKKSSDYIHYSLSHIKSTFRKGDNNEIYANIPINKKDFIKEDREELLNAFNFLSDYLYVELKSKLKMNL
ncbi:hypothetical protein [Geotoga petraea]|uniref:Uncharacterized protein n=1 Tax=Geotoga petraea TaxID=28234 RepID=A0A1G6LS90_9BACT|nr:hypothetical protein [Geotoga petraea]SDC45964.1 hypothetical protein SAMN04488588_1125 [Geotoga petraea]